MASDLSHNPQCSGQRRTRARQYLHSLDFTKEADARKFLALCENMLNAATRDSQFAKEFPKWLRKDGFVFEDGRVSNLATVAQGLAELRGLYGSGHGRDGKTRGVRPRHARLAVNAAVALVVFLFETHKDVSP